MGKYDHKTLEKKWQERWKAEHAWQAEDFSEKPKFYCLIEFPYPSGEGLHAGHLRSYSALDTIARKKRMEGCNVLFPIGWDAFGLPAENYAIKKKLHPLLVTKSNVENFRRQIRSMGISFDWSREIDTTDPKYYKWTQWIFLQLFKHGLAYKKKMPINWCPSCKIGLANEEVVDGKCERCGAAAQKREKDQWMLQITKYADRLIEDLKIVDYPDQVKTQQINWIGKSEGAVLPFLIPRYREILLATNNPSKKERIEKLIRSVGISCRVHTPQELGLETIDVDENGTLEENAQKKARAYFGKAAMPILGVDSGFFIQGEKIDQVKVKRNALDGQSENSFSQEEIAQRMVEYYRTLARKNGGEVGALWSDAWALCLPNSEIITDHSEREVILTDTVKGKVDIFLPIRSLYRAKATGKYIADHLEEDELQELLPITEALVRLLCDSVEVFTTRPDTLFGATYLVLAPEHPLFGNSKSQALNPKQIQNSNEVKVYIENAKNKSDIERTSLEKEKTGVELQGIKAINPVTHEEIPVFTADYILAQYGTGAIMAVPAHDMRDWEFAKKYHLPIRQVVRKNNAPVKSYLMGAKNILDDELKKLRIEIVETLKNGNRKIIIPKESIASYEQLIIDKLEKEFWNEYVGDDIVFLFKHQDGNVERIVLSTETEEKIDKLAAEFMGESWDKQCVWKWVAENEWYADLILHPEEGILINSGKFSGMNSLEARKAIIEFVHGKLTTTYKLRDWVFSRQHYWGEPIPVVYCEACRKKKYNFILLHGFTANSKEDFFPWLKKELKHEGHRVFCPDLPHTDTPSISEQVDFVLQNVELDEDTIIIGHSLGGVVAMKLVERAGKVSKLILVDSFIRPKFNDHERAAVEKSGDWKFDFEKIRSNAKEIIALADRNFPIIPEEQSYEMKKLLDAILVFENPSEPHFCGKKEEGILPFVLSTGWVPIPEKELPIELPQVEHYEPTDTGESPLSKITDWVNTTCPNCGGKAKRETDTMPNWAGSSWYFLRYIDPKNEQVFADFEKLKYWLPVDLYNGGMEHITLHLLYSRFWHKFLYDIGQVPTSEPYFARRSHGMVLAEDGQKMSKSRGNTINPDEVIEEYGADALRLYEMFMGPYSEAIAWSTKSLVGVKRFLEKVWLLAERVSDEKPSSELERLAHKTIKKVSEDIDGMKFNTAISSLMIFTNRLQDFEKISRESFQTLLLLLAPFAPHLCEELWEELDNQKSIFSNPWPAHDREKAKDDVVELVIQINGKLRDSVAVDAEISEEAARQLVFAREKIQRWLEGREIKKVIFVKGKLMNIVVG